MDLQKCPTCNGRIEKVICFGGGRSGINERCENGHDNITYFPPRPSRLTSKNDENIDNPSEDTTKSAEPQEEKPTKPEYPTSRRRRPTKIRGGPSPRTIAKATTTTQQNTRRVNQGGFSR